MVILSRYIAKNIPKPTINNVLTKTNWVIFVLSSTVKCNIINAHNTDSTHQTATNNVVFFFIKILLSSFSVLKNIDAQCRLPRHVSDEKELIFESIILNIPILYHTKNFFQPPYLEDNTNSVILTVIKMFILIFLNYVLL